MIRITRYLSLLAACMFLCASRAFPCTCDNTSTVRQELAHAVAIFAGRALHTEPSGIDMRKTTFIVEERWKGADEDTIEIYTGLGGGDCGYTFWNGARYLVYAYRSSGKLVTNICSRTRSYDSAAADIRELDDPEWHHLASSFFVGTSLTDLGSARAGFFVGSSLELPISPNVSLAINVLYDAILGSSGASSTDGVESPYRGSSAMHLVMFGARFRVDRSLYVMASAGYMRYALNEPIARRIDSLTTVQSKYPSDRPVINLGIGYAPHVSDKFFPYIELDLMGPLHPQIPRVSAFLKLGARVHF
jgi:hypothetical protein